MIPIDEFLNLKPLVLDLKVIHEWQHAADDAFVAFILQHHLELDYPHLRCALRILQNVDRADVRNLFRQYVNHSELGYRVLAQGSLDEQRKRGWYRETAGAH
jgi:hypothetical protein